MILCKFLISNHILFYVWYFIQGYFDVNHVIFQMDFTLSLTPAAEFFNSLDTHTAFFNLTAKVETYSTLSNPETAITNILAPIIVEESLELSK